MAFSQSFLLGEDTLNQLDMCEVQKNSNGTSNGRFASPPPCKRKHKSSIRVNIKSDDCTLNDKNNNNSPGPSVATSTIENSPVLQQLDVINESPTDKSHVLGKSIKERLRNASVSVKKSNRKHLRQSKSDPLSKNAKNRNKEKETATASIQNGHGLNEDFGSMFDNTMIYAPSSTRQTLQTITTNGIAEKFGFGGGGEDEFDHYFKDIQTQPKSLSLAADKNHNRIASPRELSILKDNFDNLFESKFTMEMENINVSEIERMMRTTDNPNRNVTCNQPEKSELNLSSEDLFNDSSDKQSPKKSATIHEKSVDQMVKFADTLDQIQWEESAFFDGFHATAENHLSLNNEMQANASLATDANLENNYLNESIHELDHNLQNLTKDELESCRLDISTVLSEINDRPHVTSFSKQRILLDNSKTTSIIKSQTQANRTIVVNKGEAVSNGRVPCKRHISSLVEWGCSKLILKEYEKKGIQQMFEWQAECLGNLKIKEGNRNLVYSAPTSAGKTFISEILLINNVVKRQKKVLVILPFISVVREKMYYLQDLLRTSGIRVEGFFGGYTPPGGFDSIDVAICTIEKANSIVNKLLEQKKIDTIGLIVVDEIHLISDPGRGYILELLLAKVLFCSKKLETNIQIVTMSATLPNAELLTKWLNAEFYHTNYRPVDLQEMIKIGNNIYNSEMHFIRSINTTDYTAIQNDQDNVGQLCMETIADGSAVIVFCPSKDWCESLALHIAGSIYKLGKSQNVIGERLRKEINMQLIDEVKMHLRNSPTGLDSVLEKTISYGVAFHHAGLTFDERDIIESAFSNGSLRVIVATSTLSSGVNLPARRVIIRTPLFGGKQMSSLTYKQMIGRAGRMGKDTMGESILVCSGTNVNVGKDLIGAELKPLNSCLDAENYSHFKRAILEIIASGMATTRDELQKFIKCTLLHSEHNFEIKYFQDDNFERYLKRTRSGKILKKNSQASGGGDSDQSDSDPIGQCMHFLEYYEFIRLHFNEETREINYIATRLGHACLASSIPPSDGFLLFSELQKARQGFVLESELHAVYLVTPFSVCYQLQAIDWLLYLDMWEKLSPSMQRVGELVGVKESFLVKAMRGNTKLDHRCLQIHKRFYTALALQELINETPINDVAAKYKFTRGVLQSLQQTASTFAGIVTSFCHALNWELLALIISQFKERLFFGVHQDLIDIMKIPILNSQRARALYNAGFHTLIDISSANLLAVEKCLYDSIDFDTKKRDGETNYDAEQRNKSRLLFVTGKAGLTVNDAAKTIIDEARLYLRKEMGLANIVWSQEANASDNNDALQQKNEESGHVEIVIDNDSDDFKLINTDEIKDTMANKMKMGMNKKSKRITKRKPVNVKTLTKEQSKDRKITINQRNDDELFDFSDVDSIDLNSPLASIHNGEDELSSFLMDDSDILSDIESVVETNNVPRFEIVDVFEDHKTFSEFADTFKAVKESGFALAIGKRQSVNGSKDTSNCIISDDLYICGLAFCFDANVAYYMNLRSECYVKNFTFSDKIAYIREIFSRKNLTLKMCDAKNQFKILMNAVPEINFKVDCILEDAKIAHWLLHPNVENSFHQMTLLYAPECLTLSKTISEGVTNPTTSPKIRASLKACIVVHILRTQADHLNRLDNGSIYKAFKEMEMPIQKSLLHMERAGMALDQSALEALSSEMNDHMNKLEAEMYRLNGKRFQATSSKSVAQVLKIRNKNGALSMKCTRADIESSSHPIAKLILEHRRLNAILSKTIQPLLRSVTDERIYGSSYSFTMTGRISMHEPNLQNVAKDFTVEYSNPSEPTIISCRSAFKVQPGRTLISADFCQLELRVLAHLSEDKTLINIFSSVNDVFTSVAAKWNKVAESQVSNKLRNDAKQICYGIIYGMGIKSLAASLKCDDKEAEDLYESFHKTYPGIRNFTQKIVHSARAKGFVETLAGRRRYLPEITATDSSSKRAQAERQAINTMIQGSAADIAKYAMLRMERNILKYQSQVKINLPGQPMSHVNLVLHLHDELLYEVPVDKSRHMIKILKSSMENCAQLLVPLKVKVKKGLSWGTMESVD